MTARPLAVIGGGEHAGVVVDAARSRPGEWTVVGFIGPAPAAHGLALAGMRHLGDDAAAGAWLAGLDEADRPWLVLGVGTAADPARRAAIVERFDDLDRWVSIIHASATVSPSATLGPGSVALAGAVVGPGAVVGSHAVLNTAAVVEHDVTVGPYVMVGPGALIGGGAVIGHGSTIGLGAIVRDHVRVGDGSVIGMGAVVVGDVADGVLVIGSPARPMASTDD